MAISLLLDCMGKNLLSTLNYQTKLFVCPSHLKVLIYKAIFSLSLTERGVLKYWRVFDLVLEIWQRQGEEMGRKPFHGWPIRLVQRHPSVPSSGAAGKNRNERRNFQLLKDVDEAKKGLETALRSFFLTFQVPPNSTAGGRKTAGGKKATTIEKKEFGD